MHQKLIIPAFAALFLLVQACTTDQEINSTDTFDRQKMSARIDSIGEAIVASGEVMGLGIAIVKDGDTLYYNGFGYADTARTKPVVPENYFLLASISKLVGTTTTMKLVEEGTLSLDATLQELLPDYPNEEQGKKVTLRHLLSHTSGIPDYAEVIDSIYLETGKSPTKEDYYQYFATHDLAFEPGENFRYSNSGFVLMAMIIEHATGQPFEQVVDRFVNQPTGFDFQLIAQRIKDPRMVQYFELVDTALIYRPHWLWIKGDGGLTNTPLQLAHFPFKWSDGTIISKASFEKMTTPTLLNDGVVSDYGLGTRIGDFEGHPVIGHTGGDKTTYAIMVFFPEEKMTIVVMLNTNNTPRNAVRVFGDVALAALDMETPDLAAIEVPDDNLARYVGDYTYKDFYISNRIMSFFQKEEGGPLYWKFKDSDAEGYRLYYLGNDGFTDDFYPMGRFVFKTNAKGEIVAINEYLNGFYFTQWRKVKE